MPGVATVGCGDATGSVMTVGSGTTAVGATAVGDTSGVETTGVATIGVPGAGVPTVVVGWAGAVGGGCAVTGSGRPVTPTSIRAREAPIPGVLGELAPRAISKLLA